MIDKSTILYKGDLWAGAFYLLNSVVMAIIFILLYYFTERIGFFYLSIGMAVLSFFSLGKGFFMIIVYRSRFLFFNKLQNLTKDIIHDEERYTKYRLQKKQINRRRYLRSAIVGSIIAFFSIFSGFKHVLIGTLVPIILMSGLEFAIGLLTEFRLKAYLMIIERAREDLDGKSQNV